MYMPTPMESMSGATLTVSPKISRHFRPSCSRQYFRMRATHWFMELIRIVAPILTLCIVFASKAINKVKHMCIH